MRVFRKRAHFPLLYQLSWKNLIVAVLIYIAITHSFAFGKNKTESKVEKPVFTPLMLAAMSCDEKQVAELLSQGADVKAVDAHGNDALTFASTDETRT